MNCVSIMFKGRNGSGPIALTLDGLIRGNIVPRVVHVQQIFSDASDGTLNVANRNTSFLLELSSTGAIQQDDGSDWSDALFLAILEIP